MVNLTWKFLQDLNRRKNSDAGFTLIELLVVIIIIGVLSAIALPSFLNQVNKAKEIEAVSHITYLNKHQTMNFQESTEFTDSFGELSLSAAQPQGLIEIGIQLLSSSAQETPTYLYGIKHDLVYNGQPAVVQVARARNFGLKSYAGIVYFENGELKKVICADDEANLIPYLIPSPDINELLALGDEKCK